MYQILVLDKAESVDNENKDHPDVFHVSEINSDILTLVIDYLKLKDKWAFIEFPIVESRER